MNNILTVVAQAIYGNRTIIDIKEENIDYVILGIMDKEICPLTDEKPDRTIIRIPDAENLVIVYNKYQEAEKRASDKPLVFIPQANIVIKSRCIICGIDDNENLVSITTEEYNKIAKYLAE